jgi:hypothetical protein
VANTPFKKLLVGGKWDDCYALPPFAFKLWLFYYRLEGKKREGWAPRLRIADKLHMNKDTVTYWREYLVKHEWLELVGYHKAKGVNEGAKGIPIMRAKHGVVPAITRTNKGWENIPVTGAASHGATAVASHGSTGAASHDVDIEHINKKQKHVDGGFENFEGGLEPVLFGLNRTASQAQAQGIGGLAVSPISKNVSESSQSQLQSGTDGTTGITRDILLPWMSRPSTFQSDDLPSVERPDSRVTLATDARLLKFLKDADYFASVLHGTDDRITTRLSHKGLWVIDTHNPSAIIARAQAKEELRKEIAQATYEANAGLFDDKAQAADAKAIEQCNRLGLGFLEQGEEIGGRGPDSFEISAAGIYLTGRCRVRCPLCECGRRVDFIIEEKTCKFWSLGKCRNCRPRCSCGQLAWISIVKDDSDAGGYVQTATRCLPCLSRNRGVEC